MDAQTTDKEPADTATQLRESRRRIKLLQTQIATKRLERVAKLYEAFDQVNWVAAYDDMLDRFRGEQSYFNYTIATSADRRYGQNIPLFRTEQELAMLRMPSRILCSANSYAIGMLEGLTSYVIGDGLQYRWAAKEGCEDVPAEALQALNAVTDEHVRRNQFHGGEQPGLEEEFFWRSCEDGEAILCHTPREDGCTDVRTIEPEQLTARPDAPWDEYSFGVKTPRDDVQDVQGYWIFFGTNPAEGEEYDPARIVHMKRNVKRSIKRGLPDFTFDTEDAFRSASKLRRNMQLGAAIQAAIAGVRQHDNASPAQVSSFQEGLADWQTTDVVTGQQKNTQRYSPGTILDIGKGYNYVAPPSWGANAGSLVEILQAGLRAAGVRWNAPEWLASADASNNNFASSLTAESPFVKTVTRRQRGYESALGRSCLIATENHIAHHKGFLPVPGLGKEIDWRELKNKVELIVTAPSPEVRNRLEEAQANQIRVQGGWKSKQTVADEEGLDWKREQQNLTEAPVTSQNPDNPASGGLGFFPRLKAGG